MNQPIFIDIEATAYDGMPVQIAWGRYTDSVESLLIYTDEALSLCENTHHNVSREKIKDEGISPAIAVVHLARALNGKTVYSDAPEFDRTWLARLEEAAGYSLGVRVESFYALFANNREAVEAYKENLLASSTCPHEATNDVKVLIQVFEDINGTVYA